MTSSGENINFREVGNLSFHKLSFKKKIESLRPLWNFDLQMPFQGQCHEFFFKNGPYFCSLGSHMSLYQLQWGTINRLGGDSFGAKHQKFIKNSILGPGHAAEFFFAKFDRTFVPHALVMLSYQFHPNPTITLGGDGFGVPGHKSVLTHYKILRLAP